MKKFFTKYIFFLFLFPAVFLVIFLIFEMQIETGEIGMNRTLSGNAVAYLINPVYHFSAFIISYLIYLSGYGLIFITGRSVDFLYSLIHLSFCSTNFFLLILNAAMSILIPLTLMGLLFFILNCIIATKSIHHLKTITAP